MRLAPVLLALSLASAACERQPETRPDSAKQVPTAPSRPGADLLRGTWQVDGFEASSPAGSASAAALQAQAGSPEAQAVRITYTGTLVQIQAPGQPVLSSSYDVLDSRPGWVRIKNGNDEVIIAFRDDDHMTVDRKGNQFGAKMKMKRASGPAPEPPKLAAGSASIAAPFQSAKVVGTSAAGNPIVKIGP